LNGEIIEAGAWRLPAFNYVATTFEVAGSIALKGAAIRELLFG
jgi:hypothetical protein